MGQEVNQSPKEKKLQKDYLKTQEASLRHVPGKINSTPDLIQLIKALDSKTLMKIELFPQYSRK